MAFAAVPLAVAVPSMVRGVRLGTAAPTPSEIVRKNETTSTMDRLPGWVYRLTIYAFLMGAAITAVLTYLALWKCVGSDGRKGWWESTGCVGGSSIIGS